MSQAHSRRDSQNLPPLRDVIASLSLGNSSPCCSPTTKNEFFEVVNIIRRDSPCSPPQPAVDGRWLATLGRHDSDSTTSNISDIHCAVMDAVRHSHTDLTTAYETMQAHRCSSMSQVQTVAHTSAIDGIGDVGAYHDLNSSLGHFQLSSDQPLQLLPGLCPSLAGHQQVEYKGIGKLGSDTVYLYTGGYYLPTHIDGEPVNAHWGLTKANTPRKRLAAACDRCRQKKTRCDPTPDGCAQCQKAGKTCQI